MSDMETQPPGGEATRPAKDGPPMPAAATLPAPIPVKPAQRNPIFAELVRGDDDLPGLIGYALYKQNKRDWLASFFKIHGRDPTEAEVESYTVGERTQRRLEIYRRLAADMIEKATANANGTPGPLASTSETGRVVPGRTPALKDAVRGAPAGRSTAERRSRGGAATLLFWIIVLIVLGVFGYWYINSSYFH